MRDRDDLGTGSRVAQGKSDSAIEDRWQFILVRQQRPAGLRFVGDQGLPHGAARMCLNSHRASLWHTVLNRYPRSDPLVKKQAPPIELPG